VGVFVGPEGGLDPKEVARLQQVGTLCSLGPLVLRTETAAVAAAAVVLSVLGFTSAEEPW
jgi:16S rRNA (uracil1498-N3)-methyltransferase